MEPEFPGSCRDPKPLITVAICTRNRAPLLREALKAVLEQRSALKLPDLVELLVVDNDSADSTARVVEELKAFHPGIRMYREVRHGLSFARNAALANTSAEWVLFLDDDAVPLPGWLELYCGIAHRPPSRKLAAAGGPVLPRYEMALPKWYDPASNRLDHGKPDRKVAAIHGPWGGNCLYLKEACLQLGGFDIALGRRPGRPAAHEDADMRMRLEETGYEIWWISDAGIQHTITRDRLTFAWECRKKLLEGKSSANLRLKAERSPSGRLLLFARWFAIPCEVTFTLGMALLLFPFSRQRGTKAFLRSARAAGLGWGLLTGFTCVLWARRMPATPGVAHIEPGLS